MIDMRDEDPDRSLFDNVDEESTDDEDSAWDEGTGDDLTPWEESDAYGTELEPEPEVGPDVGGSE